MLTFLYCKQINALLTLKTNYDNELEKKNMKTWYRFCFLLKKKHLSNIINLKYENTKYICQSQT